MHMDFQDPGLNCLKINTYNKRKKLKLHKKETLLLSKKLNAVGNKRRKIPLR